jgi:RNA polymerase-binding transcription factor DksA
MADHDADRQQQLAGIGTDLDGVEQALERLDAGTYSTCEVCGATIDEHLLAEDPVRRRCEVHGST